MSPRRALVLGGGGPIGVHWEAGLATGLHEAGFPLDSIDVIVGTSAGAIVGAHLAQGGPSSWSKLLGAERKADAAAGPPAFFDRSKLDLQALGEIYQLWGAMQLTTREQVQAIGKVVRRLDRGAHDQWVSETRKSVPPGADWPERRLCVVAVDTESGERRMFERGDGVRLARAIAASSAVPGLFPAIEIKERLYMDGQVWSSTNADLLLADRPEQVLIAMPTNSETGRGIGSHAERMLEHEIAALRAAGCDVKWRTPSSDDAQRMGTNLMDYARGPDAYAVGLATGRAWAAEL
jgi:NTE family protein